MSEKQVSEWIESEKASEIGSCVCCLVLLCYLAQKVYSHCSILISCIKGQLNINRKQKAEPARHSAATRITFTDF